MIGYYNYTVYLTYLGLVSAVVGISLALGGMPMGAVVCLMISGVCDLFDGKIARTKKDRTDEEKSFGIQIDSLCDLVCFGVLPAVLGMTIGASAWWQIAIEALFVLCGVIRLGYYNVSEIIRQKETSANRSSYKGLPITMSAMFVPLLFAFRNQLGGALPLAYSLLLLFLAVCYIAPISIKKPGKVGTVIMIAVGLAILALIIFL